MELNGFNNWVKRWVDDVYSSITVVTSLSAEDYIKFMRQYASLQKHEQEKAFLEADADGSGALNAEELAEVIASLGWRPSKRLLEECIMEVNVSGSGNIDMEEFEHVLSLLNATQGFTRQERKDLAALFDKFSTDGSGSMRTAGLSAALTFVGYMRTVREIHWLIEEVDLDGGGTIELKEFLAFMRKAGEQELAKLRVVFDEADLDGSGSLDLFEIQVVLRDLGYTPDMEAMQEVAEDCELSDEMNVQDLCEFLTLYREREGLSRTEVTSIWEAFTRYVKEGEELNLLELGKTLRWLGISMPFEMQSVMVEKVDIDRSGKVSESELRKLVRLMKEDDYKAMRKEFEKQDTSNNGFLNGAQVKSALQRISKARCTSGTGDVALDGIVESMVETGYNLDHFLRLGMDQLKRQRQGRDGAAAGDEKTLMRDMFARFDEDSSGTISFRELGKLVREMFPVTDDDLKPKLATMMGEVDRNSAGSLDFEDFMLIIRQFLDLKAEAMLQKEARAIQASGFSAPEVQDFRELFRAIDEDNDQELTWGEVKRLVGKIQVLDGHETATLFKAFQAAKGRDTETEGGVVRRRSTATSDTEASTQAASHEALDFPEFLALMRHILDINFGGVRSFKPKVAAPTTGRRRFALAESSVPPSPSPQVENLG